MTTGLGATLDFHHGLLGALDTLRHTRGGDVDDRQTIGVDLRLGTSTFRAQIT